jgi:hypothetical protein
MRESYCIICGGKKDGIEIREDHVIEAIRLFNRKVLRQPPKNNRIVVCEACYPKYKAQRKKYLGRQRLYLILGGLFVVFGVIVSLNKLEALLVGIVLIAVLYLFSLLTYVPELKAEPKPESRQK